jgi:hypothetical protein
MPVLMASIETVSHSPEHMTRLWQGGHNGKGSLGRPLVHMCIMPLIYSGSLAFVPSSHNPMHHSSLEDWALSRHQGTLEPLHLGFPGA